MENLYDHPGDLRLVMVFPRDIPVKSGAVI
jgi:hypothetical protein